MLPRINFVLVPVSSLLVMLVTRKARRNYPHHLYFTLHLHAAYFGLVALTLPLNLIGNQILRIWARWLGLAAGSLT